jgi:hypothetical protein
MNNIWIKQGCIEYTSDLAVITNYHTRLQWVHLWPASSHHKINHIRLYWVHLWPVPSSQTITQGSIEYTSDLPVITNYHTMLHWVHLWPASSHHKIYHISCNLYTSDLPPRHLKMFHIKLHRVHLWPASSHHKLYHIFIRLYWVHLWPASNRHKLSHMVVLSTPLNCL